MKIVSDTRRYTMIQPSEMRFMKELSPKNLYQLYHYFQTYYFELKFRDKFFKKCICGGISVEYPWNKRGISVELVWNKVFWLQFLHRIRIYKVFSGKIPQNMCGGGDGYDEKH